MNETIAELMAQKKELERKIRELQNQAQICGRAQIKKTVFPTSKPDEWSVSIKAVEIDREERWRAIIRNNDRQKAIDQIQTIIDDLKGLQKKLTEDET